jgi:invasion protein IalB
MLKPIAIVLMAALAAPAAAQNAAPTQATAPAASKDPNRIICERQEEIGSRIAAKKVCKTAAEWQLERQQQRDDVTKFQQQATGQGHSG